VARSLATLGSAHLVGRALAVVTNVYLARVLGAASFGVVTFALTVLSYPELLVSAGFPRLGPREIVRDPGPAAVRRLVAAVLAIRLVLSALAFAVLVAVVLALPGRGDLERQTMLLYGLYLFIVVVDLGWVAQGAEAMHVVGGAEVVVQAVTLAGTMLLVRGPEHVLRVAAVYLLAQLLGAAVTVRFYVRRYGWPGLGAPAALWKSLIRAALPLTLTRTMSMINLNFDMLMVGLVMSRSATGEYGAAYRFLLAPALALNVYFNAVTPVFDRVHRAGMDRIAGVVDRSLRLTGAAGLGCAVAGTLLAPAAFDLVFGPAYRAAVLPFQILIWSTGLLFLSRNYRTLLVSLGHEDTLFRLTVVSAAVNVGLNLVLIPRHGLAGAAVATVASEAVNLTLGYARVRGLAVSLAFGRHVLRLGAAALLAGAGLAATGGLPLAARTGVLAILYLGGLGALGIVRVDELRALARGRAPALGRS